MDSFSRLEQLRSAVIDQRAENVRYRQNELQKLHAVLRKNVDTIKAAISKDCDGLPVKSAQIGAEYYLAMNEVRRLYSSLDFAGSLKREYTVANGEDAQDSRRGKGLVILKPTTHTRFYSIISTLAMAVTAGNCVCIEVSISPYNERTGGLIPIICS
jgi:acyl-CoA reductase-like NAD-dependent aldehyde dehydrogenase